MTPSAGNVALVGAGSIHRSLLQIIQSVDGQLTPRVARPDQLTVDDAIVLAAAPSLEEALQALDQIDHHPRLLVVGAPPATPGLEDLWARPNLIACLQANDHDGPRVDQLMYVLRRLCRPDQVAPQSHDLLRWGATSISWQLPSTQNAAALVADFETIGRRLGLTRADIAATQSAAHELLMNAFYDAPVDRSGRFRYAHDRVKPVALDPSEAPRLRLTVDGTCVAIDVVDPFGQLTRARFFQTLGQHWHSSGVTPMDRSHGGAGLGLMRSLSVGSGLRAEVRPGASTQVSWWRDRRSSQPHRSAIFMETVG